MVGSTALFPEWKPYITSWPNPRQSVIAKITLLAIRLAISLAE